MRQRQGRCRRSYDLTRVVLTELKPAAKDDKGTYHPLKANQADLGPLLGAADGLWRVQFASQIWVPVLALDGVRHQRNRPRCDQ